MMQEIDFVKAPVFTSPNSLVLICTEKPDGSTNLATVSFFTYLSYEPPMIGFAMGRKSFSAQRVRETGKVIVAVPGRSLAGIAMGCGTVSGRDMDKAAAFRVKLQPVPGSAIQIPEDTKVAFAASLRETVETGDHVLYICDVDKVYGDEEREALFAWNGLSKIAPAVKK